MSVDTFTTLTTEDQLAYFERDLLERALPNLKLSVPALKSNIPKNSGRKISWRRFNQVSTATTALTEGVTPMAASVSITEVTGTAAQYGNYFQVSDFVDMAAIDKVMMECGEVMSENAEQSIEEIIRAEVVTGSSVVYATGSARSSQDASHPITLKLVNKAVRTLQSNDARPFNGERGETGMDGLFMGIIHPKMWYDLQQDTTVQNTFIYSDPSGIYQYKTPIIGGVAWFVSTKAPLFSAAGSGGADVYAALIFGKNAFGMCDIAGSGRFQLIPAPLGSAGAADPLKQRATIAWKAFQLPKILNNNFFTRIEAGVSA